MEDQKHRTRPFNVDRFLETAGADRRIVQYKRSDIIFSQGDPATTVMYIQRGAVKLTTTSVTGSEAVVAVLGARDFFGESCLGNAPVHLRTATAITPASILTIQNTVMLRLLQKHSSLMMRFIRHMLARSARVEDDLVDQLFNSSEKRLARVLLLLARYDRMDKPWRRLPKPSQEMLAGMIGTTRSRVNVFMNKFRRLGYIEYGRGGIQVNRSLLDAVLRD